MATERNAWGFSLFADDLRQEVGGKTSLMGIYQVDMIFPKALPQVITKFVIFVKYYELKDVFSDDLVLKIFLPGDEKNKPTVSQILKREDIAIIPTPYPPDDDSERIYNMTMPFIFSPLLIKEDGYISVRMQCGKTTTRLGRLMVRKATPEELVIFGMTPSVSEPPSPQPPTVDLATSLRP
jgi:hypothetical protein